MSTTEFVECAACASKPGSPELCSSCQRNRAALQRLANLDAAATAARGYLESLVKHERLWPFEIAKVELRCLIDNLKLASRTVHATPFWGQNAPDILVRRCAEYYRTIAGRRPYPLTLRLPGHEPRRVAEYQYPADPPVEIVVTQDDVDRILGGADAFHSVLAPKVAAATHVAWVNRAAGEMKAALEPDRALESVKVVCPRCFSPVSETLSERREGPQTFTHCGKTWSGVFYRRQTP